MENGCFGEDGFTQKLDDGIFPEKKIDIVWKTHCPTDDEKKFQEQQKADPKRYGNRPLSLIVRKCRENNYLCTLLAVYRDPTLMAIGAYKRGYRAGIENHTQLPESSRRAQELRLSQDNISYYRLMFNSLSEYQKRMPTVVISYEALIKNPTLYTRMLSDIISYPLNAIQTKDANAQHLSRYV